jgi:uncharacterized membrane protein YhiD involved in acid resistance
MTPGLDLLVRVGLATVLGVAIGIERQWRSRMAGLQTMALVSMGAALFLILGAYTFHRDVDPTRVAAQIVSGIGFLGAGVIMKQGLSVTGLNTAATLWATAAVGALAGAWMWREAIAGAAIIIAGNVFLHPLAARIDRLHFESGRTPRRPDRWDRRSCNGGTDRMLMRQTRRTGAKSGGLRRPATAAVPDRPHRGIARRFSAGDRACASGRSSGAARGLPTGPPRPASARDPWPAVCAIGPS